MISTVCLLLKRSTTVALAALMYNATDMPQASKYVKIITTDYSKAFDIVKQSQMEKNLAAVIIWGQVYNRIKIEGQLLPAQCDINASAEQGSAIGPVSYIITSRDLKTVGSRNCPINMQMTSTC